MHAHATDLVAFAFTANDVFSRYLEIIKVERAGGGGSYPELLLLLRNLDTHFLRGDEAGNTFVSFAGINLYLDEHFVLSLRPDVRWQIRGKSLLHESW